MKKTIIAILIVFFCLPAKAQYLLEDSNKQENRNIGQTYDFGDDSNINRGYRGFVDFGIGLCTTSSFDGDNYNMIMLSTTHGCQVIEDYLFVGGGIGYWHMYDYAASALPVFVDVRSDFYSFGKCSLFADLKLGYSIIDQTGFFMDPQFGLRFAANDKLGLNLGLGFQIFNDGELTYWNGSGLGYFNIKFGIDF